MNWGRITKAHKGILSANLSAILKTYRGSGRKSMGDPKGIRTRFNRSLEKKRVFALGATTHSIESERTGKQTSGAGQERFASQVF
jgi:hypothetical protein